MSFISLWHVAIIIMLFAQSILSQCNYFLSICTLFVHLVLLVLGPSYFSTCSKHWYLIIIVADDGVWNSTELSNIMISTVLLFVFFSNLLDIMFNNVPVDNRILTDYVFIRFRKRPASSERRHTETIRGLGETTAVRRVDVYSSASIASWKNQAPHTISVSQFYYSDISKQNSWKKILKSQTRKIV